MLLMSQRSGKEVCPLLKETTTLAESPATKIVLDGLD